MASTRRKSPIARRRRLEDEGEEDASLDVVELDDDSASEASVASAMVTPTEPTLNGRTDTELMLNGLKIADQNGAVEEIHYEDMKSDLEASTIVEAPPVVHSTAQMDHEQETPNDRRRREHEDYKKKRDADPAFVPNRGAFFMHDHRHSGPAANGFRPFGRGRGRGRGGLGGPYAPMHQATHPTEPTDSQWSHDLHETVAEAGSRDTQANINQNAYGRMGPVSKSTPIDRSLSTTKTLGTVQIRLFLQNIDPPITFAGVPVKQYTKLPDHRPPLRRDKPVRISLPDHPPRYVFPHTDRSFIFIPRAMRPNQQGYNARGRQRTGLGSHGGYSRRTSVFGGSMYGSVYTPSVAMSRRSSLAHEVTREKMISPTGSAISRPVLPVDTSRPVVRLPPSAQAAQSQLVASQGTGQGVNHASEYTENQPRMHTLPQKPDYREGQLNQIPMHQPRPQKSVSVADIESPASLSFNPPQVQQQPFHQQVPAQMNGNGYNVNDGTPHSRAGSYLPQRTTGTPLSQIPERAIHAQPFQPNPYQDQSAYYQPQYQVVPPQQGYYYPYTTPMAPSGAAPAFVPAQAQPPPYGQPAAPASDSSTAQQQNLVAQEVNGMVYYYEASQIPAVTSFPPVQYQPQPHPAYAHPMQQVGGIVGMGGMMTPSPDGFYYPQPQQGVVYYAQ